MLMARTLEQAVKEISKNMRWRASPYDQAKAVFTWMEQNIAYDASRWNLIHSGSDRRYVLHPLDVLSQGSGICGDLAVLYVALARKLGLHAQYAHVDRDHLGRTVNHACAVVTLEEKQFHVDPAYRQFDIRHQSITIQEQYVLQEDMPDRSKSTVTVSAPSPYALPILPRKKPPIIKLLMLAAASLGIWYASGLRYDESLVTRLKESIMSRGTSFSTEHGETRFTVERDAAQTWKEALYYIESAQGALTEHTLLEHYILADKDQNNTINAAEARESLDQARTAYFHIRH